MPSSTSGGIDPFCVPSGATCCGGTFCVGGESCCGGFCCGAVSFCFFHTLLFFSPFPSRSSFCDHRPRETNIADGDRIPSATSRSPARAAAPPAPSAPAPPPAPTTPRRPARTTRWPRCDAVRPTHLSVVTSRRAGWAAMLALRVRRRRPAV